MFRASCHDHSTLHTYSAGSWGIHGMLGETALTTPEDMWEVITCVPHVGDQTGWDSMHGFVRCITIFVYTLGS